LEQWATSPRHQVQGIKFARTRLISWNTNNKNTLEASRRSKAQGAKLMRATPRGAQDWLNPQMK